MNEKDEVLKYIATMKEINRIRHKLEEPTLTQEEKLKLTELEKEKKEELKKLYNLHIEAQKLYNLYVEAHNKPKPKYKPKTREKEIKFQKEYIEWVKDVIEQCKKDNDIALLNKMRLELERQKERLKITIERPDTKPVEWRDFLGREHYGMEETYYDSLGRPHLKKLVYHDFLGREYARISEIYYDSLGKPHFKKIKKIGDE